jgi:hypothetical protein
MLQTLLVSYSSLYFTSYVRGAIHPFNFNPDSVHSVSTTEAALPFALNTVLADVVDIREIKWAGVM